MYAEYAGSSGLNYKHYNLRGNIVATTGSKCSILVQYQYEAFGAIIETYGISPSDLYRSNTKYRDGYITKGDGGERQAQLALYLPIRWNT